MDEFKIKLYMVCFDRVKRSLLEKGFKFYFFFDGNFWELLWLYVLLFGIIKLSWDRKLYDLERRFFLSFFYYNIL